MKALLVIDMQAGSFTPDSPRYKTEQLIVIINRLSEAYREAGNKVFFIQHDGTKEQCFNPGTPDWEILPELVTGPNDLFISKTANDAFYLTDLNNLLRKNSIDQLTVTGCATDFCVEATIQSALVKDYRITVIKDGHTTADRPHLHARGIIDHYNWVWANMTPTNGSIHVISFQDYIAGEGSLP